MKRIITILLGVIIVSSLFSQSVPERQANYRPDGRAFVCVNGSNRYTRALYGSYADYRIETSDRPIFALYRKTDNKNIRFRAIYKGQAFQLDSADYCEARYEAGRRDYILRDKRWDNGELRLSVLAYHDSEGGIWKFSARGFSAPLQVEGLICETTADNFVRFGDIGIFEKPGGFEAPPAPKTLRTVVGKMRGDGTLYMSLDGVTLSIDREQNLYYRYERTDQDRERLASTIAFNTPDPYINTIGGTMVLAADGAWDGKVWLHGAVGWRMPLPGWRAAYMGDYLGMSDKQRIHFDAYAKSQVTNVPVTQPHLMDARHNLSRGAYKWGTPMYSDGYICRNPERNN